MKKVFAIVLCAVMLVALCACGGSSLAGTEWKLDSMKADGLEVGAEFLAGLGIEGSLVFEDKTVTLSAAGETETAEYTVDGNTISMVNNGEEMLATIEGDSIVIDMGADGIMVFVKD